MRTARRNLICASIAAAFLGGAAQAEDRGGKAEIFATQAYDAVGLADAEKENLAEVGPPREAD